jgi:hypothetical protein
MNSTMVSKPPFLATQDPCVGHPANQLTHMGYSMRTSDWRYAEWPVWRCYGIDGDPNHCSQLSKDGVEGQGNPPSWSGSADWSSIAGVELYNHTGDTGDCFDCFENQNLAYTPECVFTLQAHVLLLAWVSLLPIYHTYPCTSSNLRTCLPAPMRVCSHIVFN